MKQEITISDAVLRDARDRLAHDEERLAELASVAEMFSRIDAAGSRDLVASIAAIVAYGIPDEVRTH